MGTINIRFGKDPESQRQAGMIVGAMREGMQKRGELPPDVFYVVVYEIVDDGPDVEVKRMGPMSRRKAEKVENGVGRNLDWEHFYTAIKSEPSRGEE